MGQEKLQLQQRPLQRLYGYTPAALHRGRRASGGRPLAAGDGVQVRALTLHRGVEDPLRHATAAG
jgi:hypothetical protein